MSLNLVFNEIYFLNFLFLIYNKRRVKLFNESEHDSVVFFLL